MQTTDDVYRNAVASGAVLYCAKTRLSLSEFFIALKIQQSQVLNDFEYHLITIWLFFVQIFNVTSVWFVGDFMKCFTFVELTIHFQSIFFKGQKISVFASRYDMSCENQNKFTKCNWQDLLFTPRYQINGWLENACIIDSHNRSQLILLNAINFNKANRDRELHTHTSVTHSFTQQIQIGQKKKSIQRGT